MARRVNCCLVAELSEEDIASIFNVNKSKILKMKAIISSETSVVAH